MKRTSAMACLLCVCLPLLITACRTATGKAGILTAALPDSDWSISQWISAADAPVVYGPVSTAQNWQAADGANWFVTTTHNEKRVVSAIWMATSLGICRLYINGQEVGQEVLKPGFTHPQKTRLSFTYDITGQFSRKKGAANVLAAQVTPGWWADKIVTPNGHDGMVGRKCAFRCVLLITYDDGTQERIGTNLKSWKAGIAGPVVHSAIFDGEIYDARRAMGYDCTDYLQQPDPNEEFTGVILPTDGAEVYLRNDLSLKPVSAYIWEGVQGGNADEYGTVVVIRKYQPEQEMLIRAGETLVVDFGQNCAAIPSFLFKSREGITLTCLPAELLNDGNGARSRGMDGPEGSCHRLNLRTPQDGMMMKYIFADSKDYVSYRPECTFFGYRYLSLSATGDVYIKSIESTPVSSITPEMETGSLTTGNSFVNQLISNALWGMRSNYLSVPTDCPQRNERLGWTADTQIFAETGTFFARTKDFFHKWMRDLRDTQSPLGGFPGVAPQAHAASDEGSMMRPGWADAGVIVPWTIWKQFGDKQIVDENWEAMERFMHHVDETRYDHNALKAENGDYQWADWLSYEPLESRGGPVRFKDADGVVKPLPDVLTYWNFLGACYWAIDASMMSDMANATNRDAQRYADMTARARDYIRTTFLDEQGSFLTPVLNTMQTPALFALKAGVLEGQAKAQTIARLRKNFSDHGQCLQTGFLGTSILMETLTENGMADIAYDLLLQEKNPSWLYSVHNGATTIWERWNSYTKEKGLGPSDMNSFNHYAYGCVCAWIWKTVSGIAADTSDPGFRHIIMKPVPDKRLGHVDAVYQSAAGEIKSSWKYEGARWIWQFSIPEGAAASITLPGDDEATEFGPGSYTVEL